MDAEYYLAKWEKLLGECSSLIEELKDNTQTIASEKIEVDNLVNIIEKCNSLRTRIDTVLGEMKVSAQEASRFFANDGEIRRFYNLLQEKIREAQEVTLKAAQRLQGNMIKLDREISILRQKRKAIQLYNRNQWVK